MAGMRPKVPGFQDSSDSGVRGSGVRHGDAVEESSSQADSAQPIQGKKQWVSPDQGRGGLLITMRHGQPIVIDESILITIEKIHGRWKLRLSAPNEIKIRYNKKSVQEWLDRQ